MIRMSINISTKIVKFIVPGSGVQALERDQDDRKKIKQIHCYNIYETIYLNCEIYVPWVRG